MTDQDDDKPEDDMIDESPDDEREAGEPSTDSESSPNTGSSDDLASLDDDEEARMRELVRGAMKAPTDDSADVLTGFQRKIRQRSRGKFYADGWSTSKEPPISTYLVTSLVMLAIIFVVYAVLGPLSGAAVQVSPPAPVRVVPPPRLPPPQPPKPPAPVPTPKSVLPPPSASAPPAPSAR